MDKKEILERLKNTMLCNITSIGAVYALDLSTRTVKEKYNELNEKDKELEDLLYFYHIKGTDSIDEDIEIDDYKDIIPCINIYKQKGIKGVNEYLRNISNSNTKVEVIKPQTTTYTNTTKEQKNVITDNQEQTTTDLKEKIVKCFFSGKCGADFYIKSIQKQYALCDEKDQELEKLIDFYWSMENDIINTDLEKDINYKDILSCIPIYKENGIKGVEEYLGKEK